MLEKTAIQISNERWLKRRVLERKKPAKRHPWRLVMKQEIRELARAKEREAAASL